MEGQMLRRVPLGASMFLLALVSATAAQEPGPLPAAAQASPAQPGQKAPDSAPAPGAAAKIEVPSGTHLPLVLHNAISTRNARAGDPVYLETLFPIVVDGHVVIPAGSYVSGEITESKRPGRVKGRGELAIRLNTLILPNAYIVNFNAVPGAPGTGGNETVDNEGKIKGDTDKASDVGTIMKTTGAGAGIGAIATRTPKGAGIGAAAGAGVGLLTVLLTRGPEAELPRGSTLDAILSRPLFLDPDKVQFKDPGQASTLAGPPNREPTRSRVPF
jgi:hypothetical protein